MKRTCQVDGRVAAIVSNPWGGMNAFAPTIGKAYSKVPNEGV
jgi:hypothetical protein